MWDPGGGALGENNESKFFPTNHLLKPVGLIQYPSREIVWNVWFYESFGIHRIIHLCYLICFLYILYISHHTVPCGVVYQIKVIILNFAIIWAYHVREPSAWEVQKYPHTHLMQHHYWTTRSSGIIINPKKTIFRMSFTHRWYVGVHFLFISWGN